LIFADAAVMFTILFHVTNWSVTQMYRGETAVHRWYCDRRSEKNPTNSKKFRPKVHIATTRVNFMSMFLLPTWKVPRNM